MAAAAAAAAAVARSTAAPPRRGHSAAAAPPRRRLRRHSLAGNLFEKIQNLERFGRFRTFGAFFVIFGRFSSVLARF